MKQVICIAFLLFISCEITFGQGTLKGKVTDDKGENLIGVIVMSKNDKTVATSTDIDGNYSLKIKSSSAQIISVSYVGYQTILDTIRLRNGEEKTKDYKMGTNTVQLDDVQVLGRAKKSDDKYMENVKAKSVSTIDFISSATMKKTGDANVAAAVGRVSGVSSNGSFISVRGIGDRYVKTAINGMKIPTLDPFTNNIKLDIFPSSMVDNIILTKTPTADLPGDWAGAYISIETKDYPDKLAVNIESSWGFNNQTSFKNVVSSERSSTDWLGYDGGLRSYDHSSYSDYILLSNSLYGQYVALGLGDYLKSIGVTSDAMFNKNADTYNKLVYVQLGLLDKNKIDNQTAITTAMNNFKTTYYNEIYDKLNKSAESSSLAFKRNWETKMRMAPLNNSQTISIGNKMLLFGHTFGYFIGFKYSTSTQYDPKSYSTRRVLGSTGSTIDNYSNQLVSKEINGWNSLVNLSYAINKNNKFALIFMPNIMGVNYVKSATSIINSGMIDTIKTDHIYKSQINYEQRKQLVYQFKSEHFIPGPDLKIECNASLTNGSSVVPDAKISSYQMLDSLNPNFKEVNSASRYFRYLDERVIDSKLNFEIPIFKNSELSKKIKWGFAYLQNNRNYNQYLYQVPYDIGQVSNIDNLNDTNQFRIYKGSNGFHTVNRYYESLTNPMNRTIGMSQIEAGYIMFDVNVTTRIRFSGGARIEHALIQSDAVLYDTLNIPNTDSRRIVFGQACFKGIIDTTNILPSAALVYKIIKSETNPLNFKVNYARTVARPSIREISSSTVYDVEVERNVFGNVLLRPADVNNYDLRLEYSTKKSDNVAVSAFYKDFKNHIELADIGTALTWCNAEKAWLKGIEFEGKKMITKNIDFRTNIAIINSKSIFTPQWPDDNGNIRKAGQQIRPMYGQSPYVVNAMVTYASDSLKMSFSVSYNVQGPKMIIASDNGLDVYERSRQLLDAKITKGIGKHFTTSFTVKDILSTSVIRSYKFNNQWLDNYDSYHWGTNYQLSLIYKL